VKRLLVSMVLATLTWAFMPSISPASAQSECNFPDLNAMVEEMYPRMLNEAEGVYGWGDNANKFADVSIERNCEFGIGQVDIWPLDASSELKDTSITFLTWRYSQGWFVTSGPIEGFNSNGIIAVSAHMEEDKASFYFANVIPVATRYGRVQMDLEGNITKDLLFEEDVPADIMSDLRRPLGLCQWPNELSMVERLGLDHVEIPYDVDHIVVVGENETWNDLGRCDATSTTIWVYGPQASGDYNYEFAETYLIFEGKNGRVMSEPYHENEGSMHRIVRYEITDEGAKFYSYYNDSTVKVFTVSNLGKITTERRIISQSLIEEAVRVQKGEVEIPFDYLGMVFSGAFDNMVNDKYIGSWECISPIYNPITDCNLAMLTTYSNGGNDGYEDDFQVDYFAYLINGEWQISEQIILRDGGAHHDISSHVGSLNNYKIVTCYNGPEEGKRQVNVFDLYSDGKVNYQSFIGYCPKAVDSQ
jgi:hypothetical protein